MAFSWSNYQQAVFQFIEAKPNNLLVEAVAGSGKSTTLLEIARRIKGTVGIVAFNKAIAEELKGKIAKFRETDANMSGVDAKTIHAAGNAAVMRFAGDQKVKANKVTIDDKKVDKIVAELVAGRPGKEEEARPDLAEFASFIIAAVKMAKNLAFGVRGGSDIKDMSAWLWMIYHYTIDDKLPEKVEDRLEDKAIPACMAVLRRSNRDTKIVDFSDMVYLPLVHDMKIWQYDCLMVDEAQDLNLARILLAEKMVRRGGRMVFVGDPRQCIYGFTGAMPDALDYIKKKFKCQTLPLSVCYRCARKIVEYAHRVVSHIQAAPNAAEGRVLFIGGDEFDTMDLRPTDAILCRVNAPLVTLAFSLIRRGIACKIEGREIGSGLISLASRWKVKKLDTLKTRLNTYRDREVKKAMEKDDAERADAIADKVETLMVLVERAQSLNLDVDGLKAMIEDMFSDDVSKKGLLTLCSYHRSKGREFERVFRINHYKHCPSRFAKQPHQIIAEENLDYVSTTRAELELFEVDLENQTLQKQEAQPEKEKVEA
jgi:superfamily I DNA/RNA helicase